MCLMKTALYHNYLSYKYFFDTYLPTYLKTNVTVLVAIHRLVQNQFCKFLSNLTFLCQIILKEAMFYADI